MEGLVSYLSLAQRLSLKSLWHLLTHTDKSWPPLERQGGHRWVRNLLLWSGVSRAGCTEREKNRVCNRKRRWESECTWAWVKHLTWNTAMTDQCQVRSAAAGWDSAGFLRRSYWRRMRREGHMGCKGVSSHFYFFPACKGQDALDWKFDVPEVRREKKTQWYLYRWNWLQEWDVDTDLLPRTRIKTSGEFKVQVKTEFCATGNYCHPEFNNCLRSKKVKQLRY